MGFPALVVHARSRLCAAMLLVPMALCSGAAHARPQAGVEHVRTVTVDNTRCASPLARYPVHVQLDAAHFDFADALPDGADLRFTSTTGAALPFWIESWDPASSAASVWVRADSLPASGRATLLLHYGDPEAGGTADPHGTFPFYDGFESRNATGPLVTPTYDGSGQGMHPSVVHVPGGWNGWSYWMVVTPYPFDNDGLENPSILVSNDGLAWVEPEGIANPIVPPFAGGYNNDGELLLQGDKLVCYYNETRSADSTTIRRLESPDGVHWSAPVRVLAFPNYEMSPTVVAEGSGYRMWYVVSAEGCWAGSQAVYTRTSADGHTWSNPQLVSFDDPAIVPWHPEVRRDGDAYVMLVAAYAAGSTCEHTDLYYARSEDGVNWTYAPHPLIARSAGAWDDLEVYRSSFLVEDGRLRVWYSASSTAHVWGTAYAEGTLQEFMAAGNPAWDYSQGAVALAVSPEPVRSGRASLRQDGGSTYPQVSRNITGKIACTAWFYDDLDVAAEHAALLRVWDSAEMHAVGVGLYTGQSTTNYVTHTEYWNYTTTELERTAGWHQLAIRVADDTCRISIDGTNVANLTVLDAADITRFSIEGDEGGTHWLDDVYARPCVEPEPRVTVSAPDGLAGVGAPAAPAFTGARLGAARPNPAPAGTAIPLTLGSAQDVFVRVVGLQGEVVRTLADGALAAGTHLLSWDGRDARGRRAPSGVYFVLARTGSGTHSRRVVLLK